MSSRAGSPRYLYVPRAGSPGSKGPQIINSNHQECLISDHLQVSGYFGYNKQKVPGSLVSDEVMVGSLMMEIIFNMQYNSHSVTQSSDAKEIK